MLLGISHIYVLHVCNQLDRSLVKIAVQSCPYPIMLQHYQLVFIEQAKDGMLCIGENMIALKQAAKHGVILCPSLKVKESIGVMQP